MDEVLDEFYSNDERGRVQLVDRGHVPINRYCILYADDPGAHFIAYNRIEHAKARFARMRQENRVSP